MTPPPRAPRARLACLLVPLFPLAARLRSEPELKGEPVAVFEGNGNAARVLAATRPARNAGIRAGMTLPQARAILPKLIARGRDIESERAADEALLEIADAFSPRVEDAGGGVVYIDLAGIPGLSGKTAASASPEEEKALGRRLITAVEKGAFLPARVGIAASKLAARVAALLTDSPQVVPEGDEAGFLAPLPLDRLAPEIGIASRLAQWGIRSVGELARLPEGEVASRLGELGRELHATARGYDPRPLEPRIPALALSEGMDLEWPLVTLEPFLFVGHAALERLVARLESQALACMRLEVLLKLDPDGVDARAIDLPAPTRDVKTLLTLLRLELEARPPGSPVAGFTFSAHPDKPRRAQLSLFGPLALSPDRLATTIARLASLLGADRVGSPRTVDGHRPERYALATYAPPSSPDLARPPKSGRGLLAVRVLRPPVPLEVIVIGDRSRETVKGWKTENGKRETPGSREPENGNRKTAVTSTLRPERRPVGEREVFAPSLRSPLPVPPLTPGEGRDEGRAPASLISPSSQSSRSSDPPIPLIDHPITRSPAHPIPPRPPLPAGEGRGEGHISSPSPSPRSSDPPIPLIDHPITRSPDHPIRTIEHLVPSVASIRLLSMKSLPGSVLEIHGNVRVAAGPWSLEEGWWSDTPVERDYWDVELSDGGLYRIFRDRKGDAWFADGLYD